MQVAYTLNELNASNDLSIIVAQTLGTKIPLPKKFDTLEEACLFFMKLEKESKKKSNVRFDVRDGYLVFQLDEKIYLSIIKVLGRHLPAIIGFLVSIRGLFIMFKSNMKALKKDFEEIE